MLGRTTAFALEGVEAVRVLVEAEVRRGLPAFTVVGLADKAVREARERSRAALLNSGYLFPESRLTVNLAPASLRKAGAGFDLPLAIAILVASGQLDAAAVSGCAAVGELSMLGEVRPVHGVLAVAEGAARAGLARVVVPRSRAREAALVPAVEVVAVETLQEAVDVLAGRREPAPLPGPAPCADAAPEADLSELRGHNAQVDAVLVAAAGGHNLHLHGPPGTGKTMLARRIGGLLPELSHGEALEVTRIHSVAGRHDGSGLIERRPFRAPHHTISASGLVGGGSVPRPGEVTLAHHGVLFLDELAEFARPALEALRQPLEDGRVVIVRAQRVSAFPTRCMLVAASNPCPCGPAPRGCRCTAADLARYERRLSGPLLDRIDLSIHLARPTAAQLASERAPSSASVRERVAAARALQARRLAGTGASCNAQLTPRMLGELVEVSPEGRRLLAEMHDREHLSVRGHHRVLRVARTVADLAGSARVEREHLGLALGYRASSSPEARAA